MTEQPIAPGVRRLLRLAMLTWPRAARRRHGPAALEAAESALRADTVHLRAILGEAVALARSGLSLRLSDLDHFARASTLGWARDARHALRSFRRAPGFSTAAVLTLALGIGANAVVFSTVDRVLLQPPPYRDSGDLVLVWTTREGSSDRIPMAGPDAAVLRDRATRLEDVAFTTRAFDGSVEGPDAVRHVRVAAVTPDFFGVLGATPELGRTFAADGRDDGGDGVVLSHEAWTRLLGADPEVVGRPVRVNGIAAPVLGIMPAGFRLVLPPRAGVDGNVDVWVPLGVPLTDFHRSERLLDQDSDNTGAVVARLTPGATPAEADAEASSIAASLRTSVPGYADAGVDFSVRPLHRDATADERPVLVTLLAGGVLVLLIALLNVATLLLARGLDRRGEFAVRTALGAVRGHLARQLATESMILVGIGTAGALALAWWVAPVLNASAPWSGPVVDGVLGVRTLVLTSGVALAAAVVLAVAPLVHAGRSTSSVASTARSGPEPVRFRSGIIVAEIALTVVLVLSAGFLLRTARTLVRVQPGFDPRGALAFDVSMRGVAGRYRGPAARAALAKEIQSRLVELPDVRAAGYVGALPLSGDRWTQPYGLPGQPESTWDRNRADFRVASSGLFAALGTRLLEGRAFTDREDVQEGDRVVIVDRALAERVAPGGSAVDAVIGVPVDGRALQARIVGVVEPIRYETLDGADREAIYVPYRQEASLDISFVVRTGGDPAGLAPSVRAVIRDIDPALPIHRVQRLSDYVSDAVAPRRFAWMLLGAFALLGLATAAVGLYGLVSYEVGRRTPEIGIRMAVGAGRGQVLQAVLTDALKLGFLGVGCGVLLSFAVLHGLDAVLVGVGRADPVVWIGTVATVGLVTLLACALPAYRAAGLDPTEALRRAD